MQLIFKDFTHEKLERKRNGSISKCQYQKITVQCSIIGASVSTFWL